MRFLRGKAGRFTYFVLLCLGLGDPSFAYVLEGAKWQYSRVNVRMELSATAGSLQYLPSFPLFDGSTSWEQVYTGAAGVWNGVMASLQLTTSPSPAINPGAEDGINEAYFGTSIAGYNLQPSDLAITTIYYEGGTMEEADTVFKSTVPWNSYTGPLLNAGNGPIDFRRVAIHELGHTIGLGDINGTNPPAIMDIDVSDIYYLTPDDIAGAQFLYGAPAGAPAPSYPVPTSPVILPFLSYSGDFNGDGKQDILWRNSQTGEVRVWYMNGATVLSNDSIATVGLDWKIVGIGDFDGSGFSDIVWENSNDGSFAIWAMRGDSAVSHQYPSPGYQWSITGIADLDNTGLADILWRNVVTGEVRVWLSVGPYNFSSQFIGTASLDWNLVGPADLFGDGLPELIWRNQNTGEVRAWRLSDDVIIANVSLGFAPLDWVIVGFGDFTGSGSQDILWRNTVDGSVDAWIMNGFTIAAQWFPGAVSLDWQIRATPDVKGNGINSILWSNVITGQQAIWVSNGSGFIPGAPFAVASPVWAVQPRVVTP